MTTHALLAQNQGSVDRWQEVRECWLDLQDPKLQSFDESAFPAELLRQHAVAIDALTAGKALDPKVAHAITVAFEQAVFHIRRQMATCYIMLPPEFIPRQDLTDQAAALAEMAERSDIDPATVDRARAALTHAMAWLARFEAGQQPGMMQSIKATPEEAEAARVLINVLLERESS
jgi:hypothetical protein